MTKELEALIRLAEAQGDLEIDNDTIGNNSASDAMECLENLEKEEEFDVVSQHSDYHYLLSEDALNTIKQALLKLDFLEDAIDLPTNCLSTFKNRNGDEVTVMRREIYEEYQENKEILNIIFEKNVDIEMIKLYNNYEDYCRDKEKYSIRKALWLTEKEFKLIKKYCDKKGKGE